MSKKIVTLTRGLTVGKSTYKNLELREPTLGDMCAAEFDADLRTSPISYKVALAAQVTVRADDFPGPFTVGMFHGMVPSDWRKVAAAMDELDKLGEPEPEAGATS